MRGRRTPTLLGLKLALSNGPNKVDVSLPSPEDGNRFIFRNIVFSSYLEFRRMDKIQNASDFK
jgi:hypothetical protein